MNFRQSTWDEKGEVIALQGAWPSNRNICLGEGPFHGGWGDREEVQSSLQAAIDKEEMTLHVKDGLWGGMECT